MKRVLAVLAAVVMTMALLTSCGSGNTPSGVVKAGIKCMEKKDFKGYVDLTDATEQQKEALVQLLEKVGKQGDEKGGLDKYEILEETIDEDGATATVKVKITYKDGSEETRDLKTVKKDGKWLLTGDK